MSDEPLIAVFVDFENLALGVRDMGKDDFRIELVLKRNLSLRLDYGVAQSDVRDVESGDNETTFVATFRY